jgi:hypothetical protein
VASYGSKFWMSSPGVEPGLRPSQSRVRMSVTLRGQGIVVSGQWAVARGQLLMPGRVRAPAPSHCPLPTHHSMPPPGIEPGLRPSEGRVRIRHTPGAMKSSQSAVAGFRTTDAGRRLRESDTPTRPTRSRRNALPRELASAFRHFRIWSLLSKLQPLHPPSPTRHPGTVHCQTRKGRESNPQGSSLTRVPGRSRRQSGSPSVSFDDSQSGPGWTRTTGLPHVRGTSWPLNDGTDG